MVMYLNESDIQVSENIGSLKICLQCESIFFSSCLRTVNLETSGTATGMYIEC